MIRRGIVGLVLLLSLGGCGKTGPLYLPPVKAPPAAVAPH